MDADKLAIDVLLKGITEEQQASLLESIKDSVTQAKTIQKQRIGENVQVVIQALQKMEADLRGEYSDVADKLSERIVSIKDGQDGRNGADGRDGKDGRAGSDGIAGVKGEDGLPGRDGVDGVDGVSVTDASIDFDGSLVITLSSGRVINVGEVVSQELANNIKVISTMSTNGAVGIKDEGTSISTGVKNINFVGATVTATASGDDVTVNVSAGTGTVTSVAATAGTGISVTGSPITTTGTLNITNTAPDQVVSLTGAGSTTITGTYPSFTISSSGGSGTVTSVAVSGGTTGLTTSGGPITTTGTITLAGTLAVANGGTGVTTSTGTTNVVLSNSPTLVTPALGTPSALVGTNITGTATSFTASNVTTNANLTGDVTSVGNATTLTNAPVIAKVLTGYVSGAGTVAATDSILQAIQKLNGNDATNANLTGVVTSVGNATSIADAALSIAKTSGLQTALDSKQPLDAALTALAAGSDFVQFTGPLTTTKVFTLPNASSTLLVSGGALNTPSSGTLTNATGLPISTGVSGLGTGVATFLATPSSANLAAAVTGETGTGALVFASSPTLTTPVISSITNTGTITLPTKTGTLALNTITTQVFTAGGTYTRPTGLAYALVYIKAGGASGASSTTGGYGASGGEGEEAWGIFTAATIGASQTVTIGAGGAAVALNTSADGNAGGTTSFGALMTAAGAAGGTRGNFGGAPAAGGNGGTGGVYRMRGAAGNVGSDTSGTTPAYNAGGGKGAGTYAAAAGANSGGGGGGGSTGNNSGAGGSGICVVYEYY
jgi:hypothetical protein